MKGEKKKKEYYYEGKEVKAKKRKSEGAKAEKKG